MDTIDEQLDHANARVVSLEGELAELSARSTELATEKEQLSTKNAELTAANNELRENLSHSQEKLSQSDAAQRSTLEENSQLKAAAKSAEEKAAEFYGPLRHPWPQQLRATPNNRSRSKSRLSATRPNRPNSCVPSTPANATNFSTPSKNNPPPIE